MHTGAPVTQVTLAQAELCEQWRVGSLSLQVLKSVTREISILLASCLFMVVHAAQDWQAATEAEQLVQHRFVSLKEQQNLVTCCSCMIAVGSSHVLILEVCFCSRLG